MSKCLNDARLQAAADDEATEEEREHVRSCSVCATRVRQARQTAADFARKMSAVSVPPRLELGVAEALSRPASERRGATTLRRTSSRPRTWLMAGGALAAAVIAIVFVLLPTVDPGTRLSAAEILNRSLETLMVHGTERLKYELSIDAPSAASDETGTFVIEQLIDHQSGRWRFSRFAPDGTLLSGIAEDPAANTRDAIMVMDGQTYHFQFAVPPDQRVPLWDLQRRYAETMIGLVQASGAQVVTTEQGADGPRYVIDLPSVERAGALPAPFDLNRARIVIDASDFHVVEFTAAGRVMGERVSVGYRLIERSLSATPVAPADFALPRVAGAIELEGDGTKQIPRDVLSLLLREVAQARR